MVHCTSSLRKIQSPSTAAGTVLGDKLRSGLFFFGRGWRTNVADLEKNKIWRTILLGITNHTFVDCKWNDVTCIYNHNFPNKNYRQNLCLLPDCCAAARWARPAKRQQKTITCKRCIAIFRSLRRWQNLLSRRRANVCFISGGRS